MKKVLLLSLLVSFSLVFSFNTAEYTSAKVLGLGGAYTAIANDEMALFYNPAGLAYIDSGMMGHINFEGTVAVDDGFTGIVDTVASYNANFSNAALTTALNGKSGSQFFGGGVSYFTNGISLGAFTSNKLFTKYNTSSLFADLNRTSLFCMGFASKLQEDLAVGITLKALKLESIQGDILYTDLGSGSGFDGKTFNEDDFQKRFLLGSNVGAMYKLGALGLGASVENLFTLEATKENANGNIVSANNTASAPKPVVRLGLGFYTGDTLLAADVANLTDANNTTYHFGVQQKLLDIPFLEWLGGITARAGYLTGKKENIEISSVTYGAQARFLIAYLNANYVDKTIGGNKSKEYNVSGQITF